MYADPQTVTINAVGKTLARISTTGTQSVYQSSDGVWKLTLSHTIAKGRVRTLVRLEQRAIVPDPLTAVNDYETLIDYHVIDRPEIGFTTAQVQQQIAGANTWLDAASVAKLVGLET